MALLHQECLHLATSGPMASPLISQKEVKLKFLKAQLFSLQNPPPVPTKPLGNETARLLFMKNMALHAATFEELYQTSLPALEKLCNHQKFLQQLQERANYLVQLMTVLNCPSNAHKKNVAAVATLLAIKRRKDFSNENVFQHFPAKAIKNGVSSRIRRTKELRSQKDAIFTDKKAIMLANVRIRKKKKN
ncbi:hypothetical protein LIER_13383 [Lithospermum erythrorhizon]|uniref:Uncharacterized protein n=1 Tax=Lithospermum erythrorhizon TaxID=34254 RepID=A0AAV3PXE3_LITER